MARYSPASPRLQIVPLIDVLEELTSWRVVLHPTDCILWLIGDFADCSPLEAIQLVQQARIANKPAYIEVNSSHLPAGVYGVDPAHSRAWALFYLYAIA